MNSTSQANGGHMAQFAWRNQNMELLSPRLFRVICGKRAQYEITHQLKWQYHAQNRERIVIEAKQMARQANGALHARVTAN